MGNATPPASVIVCTLNRPAALRACLASLCAQTHVPGEVVVVRGAPTSIPEEIMDAFPTLSITVIDCFGRNIAASRNAGLHACSNPLALFIDDDGVARADWVASMIDTFSQAPDLWAVGGDVFDSRTDPPELEFSHGTISLTGRQRPVRSNGAASPPTQSFANVKGCNFGVIRDRIIDLGGFDEFYEFAFEEADLMVRVARAGGRVAHSSDAVVFHAHTPGLYRQSDHLDRDWEVEFRSHLYFCLKHSPSLWRNVGRMVVTMRRMKLRARATRAVLERRISRARAADASRAARMGVRAAKQAFAARQAGHVSGVKMTLAKRDYTI